MLKQLSENLWYPFFNFLNLSNNLFINEVNSMLSFYTKLTATKKTVILTNV
jgi:hypothetical protein